MTEMERPPAGLFSDLIYPNLINILPDILHAVMVFRCYDGYKTHLISLTNGQYYPMDETVLARRRHPGRVARELSSDSIYIHTLLVGASKC